MSGLMDILNSDIAQNLINGASQETGAPKHKTENVLSMGLPLLLGAMKKNAQSPEGAASLMSALSGKHDGSILDNLGSLLGGDGVDKAVKDDGEGIVNHVLKDKKPVAEETIAQKVGLDAATVSQILKIGAPILMGLLGKKTREHNVNESGGLSSILGGMLGGQSQGNHSLITSLLDRDGDGSIMDDVGGMLFGGNKDKNSKDNHGSGGMLGGLFGK